MGEAGEGGGKGPVAPFTERARHKASQPGNKRKSLRCLRRHLIVCPSLSARVFPLSPLPPVPLQARSRSVVLRDVESSGLPRITCIPRHRSADGRITKRFGEELEVGTSVFALWMCIVLSYPSRVVRKAVLIWPLTAKQLEFKRSAFATQANAIRADEIFFSRTLSMDRAIKLLS